MSKEYSVLVLASLPMLALYTASIAQAKADERVMDDSKIEVIEVRGVRQRLKTNGRVADMIQKTELLSDEDLFNMQAVNLSKAVDASPGIRVNNECSMCGMKRVMINGAKGEHTTIMVDGVPMHSVVSSYYGVDAIGTAGVESIEIARGSGASLIAPEAIGGTINIVTANPTEDTLSADLSLGNYGYLNGQVTATAINDRGDVGLLVSAQKFEQDQADDDHNGVSENASMKNDSVMIKLIWDASPSDSVEFRTAFFKSDILGGPTGVSKTQALASIANGKTQPADFFTDGDIRLPYLGHPYETAETIDTQREEYTFRWIHDINGDLNWAATSSYIEHGQDSFYSGFDYVNDDEILYLDFKLNYYLNEDHLLTTGVDTRIEEMRSESEALLELQQEDPNIKADDFDYETHGFYLQDVWTPTNMLEVSLALRIDNIQADFLKQTEVGNEFDETLFTPRMHIRWDHSEHWVSRISAGTGYRAPLTFFESEHGILEDGFLVDVHELEKSMSYGYALSYETDTFAATLSAAYTEIDDLAYIETDGVPRPTLRNFKEKVDSTTLDLMWDYQLTDELALNGGFEYFHYSDEYKGTFSVLPVEERITFGADWDYNGWDVVVSVSWIGERDLNEWGYGGRYNVFKDLNDNGLVDAGELSDPKSDTADAYFFVSTKISYALTDDVLVYIGADNLLDYTQVNDMDSPLYWEDVDGQPSYDVAHIYGPLRGRQAYAGIKISL